MEIRGVKQTDTFTEDQLLHQKVKETRIPLEYISSEHLSTRTLRPKIAQKPPELAARMPYTPKKLTWKPKKSPIKTTGLLDGDYMGFHVSLGSVGGPPNPVIVIVEE